MKIKIMMNNETVRTLLISLISSGYCYISLINIIPILKRFAVAIPNKRSLHKSSTPTGAGIVFSIIGSIATLFTSNFLPLICLPISIMGLIDDISSLPIKRRLLLQTLTTFLLLIFSGTSNTLFLSFNIFFVIGIMIFLIFCGVAMINFINFADGIDGLVGGCFVVYLATYSFLYEMSMWPFVGLLMVFLVFNWQPAKLFMGDAGSTYLGAIMVCSIFKCESLNSAISLILIGVPLLGDTCFCVLRRIKDKQKVFEPHRLHLFQRLILSGMTHRKVSQIYILATALISLSYIFGGLKIEIVFTFITLIIALILEKRFAIPFNN